MSQSWNIVHLNWLEKPRGTIIFRIHGCQMYVRPGMHVGGVTYEQLARFTPGELPWTAIKNGNGHQSPGLA